MPTKRKPPPPKVEVPIEDAMQRTGFSQEAAENIGDFWSRMGVTGVRVGRTVLKVKPKKE